MIKIGKKVEVSDIHTRRRIIGIKYIISDITIATILIYYHRVTLHMIAIKH